MSNFRFNTRGAASPLVILLFLFIFPFIANAACPCPQAPKQVSALTTQTHDCCNKAAQNTTHQKHKSCCSIQNCEPVTEPKSLLSSNFDKESFAKKLSLIAVVLEHSLQQENVSLLRRPQNFNLSSKNFVPLYTRFQSFLI